MCGVQLGSDVTSRAVLTTHGCVYWHIHSPARGLADRCRRLASEGYCHHLHAAQLNWFVNIHTVCTLIFLQF